MKYLVDVSCYLLIFLPPAYEVSQRLCFQRFCPSVHRWVGGWGVGGVYKN